MSYGWFKKKCKCTLCDAEPFMTVTEGKRHVFNVHRKPFNKTREYLEIVK